MRKHVALLAALLIAGSVQAAPSFRYGFATDSVACGYAPEVAVDCSPFVSTLAKGFLNASTLVVTLETFVNDSATYHYLYSGYDNQYEYQNDGFVSVSGDWTCGFYCRIDSSLGEIAAFLSGSLDVVTVYDDVHMSGGGDDWSGWLRTDAIMIEPTIWFTGQWRLTQVVPEPGSGAVALLAALLIVCFTASAPRRRLCVRQ